MMLLKRTPICHYGLGTLHLSPPLAPRETLPPTFTFNKSQEAESSCARRPEGSLAPPPPTCKCAQHGQVTLDEHVSRPGALKLTLMYSSSSNFPKRHYHLDRMPSESIIANNHCLACGPRVAHICSTMSAFATSHTHLTRSNNVSMSPRHHK